MSDPMIDDPLGGRRVKEWIGKTPDSRPPATVRARIFARAKGICHLSGRKISGKDWELEHVKALGLGGENRERNLAPALVEPHKEKTRSDNKTMDKADRIRLRHLGALPKPKGNARLRSRGFDKTRDWPA